MTRQKLIYFRWRSFSFSRRKKNTDHNAMWTRHLE